MPTLLSQITIILMINVIALRFPLELTVAEQTQGGYQVHSSFLLKLVLREIFPHVCPNLLELERKFHALQISQLPYKTSGPVLG